MTRAWMIAVVALGASLCGFLSGCAVSEPMPMDSNSNWLRPCDDGSQCGEGQVCSCGVCTVACEEDAMCRRDDGPDAVCVALDDGRCEGHSRGAVCLEVCERSSQCDDELGCSNGACGVFATMSIDDGGLDAGMPADDAIDAEPVEAIPDATLDVTEGSILEADATPGSYAGPGCEAAGGERVPCTGPGTCDEGLVCHIDGRCIQPGLCAADGTTTLAEVGDIREMQKDATHLYLLEYGSEDMFGTHNNDGAFRRISQLGGALEPVVTGLGRGTSNLRVDATRLYWLAGYDKPGVWAADKATGAGADVLVGGNVSRMEPVGDYLYYVILDSSEEPQLERANKTTGDRDVLPSDGLANLRGAWGFDVDDSGFYYAAGPALYRIPLEGGSASVTEEAALPVDGSGIATGRDSVFHGHGYGGLSAVPKAGGAAVRLSALEFDDAISGIVPHHDYVYGVRLNFGSGGGENQSLVRIPVTPGDLDTLVMLPSPAREVPFTVTDNGLFWIQQGRLVRKVIPEFYADGHGPAEGEFGGPCFGDLTCGSGLACIDTVCQHVPFRGAGCTPADPLRPSCSGPGLCSTGLVCHIDGTCIEPGTCDAEGRTTLAEIGSVRGLASDASDLYLLDYGTEDDLGNHNQDGAIRRLPLLGGSLDAVVGGLGRTNDLLIDGEHVFWSEGPVTDLTLWRADKLDGGNKDMLAHAENLHWAQDATDIYFVTTDHDEAMGLFRVAKSGGDVEPLADLETFAEIAVGGQSVYGYGAGLWSLPLTGGSADPIAVGTGPDAFALGPDALYYGSSFDGGVRTLPKGGGKELTLSLPSNGGWALELRPYRDHVYFSHSDGEGHPQLLRAPTMPGTTETLAAWSGFAYDRHDLPFTINDQGLYWVQEGRVVRRVLGDEAAAQTPAQGAFDGPCYGDLGCDGALSCIDSRCE